MPACESYGAGPVTGADCFLYIDLQVASPPNLAEPAPVWQEIGAITDLSVDDFSLNLAEIKRRKNKFTKSVPSLFNAITLSWRLIHGIGETQFTQLRDAFMARRVFMAMVTDGDVTDATANPVYALVLPVVLTAFPWDQPLEDITGHDMAATLGYLCDAAGNEVDPEYRPITADIVVP